MRRFDEITELAESGLFGITVPRTHDAQYNLLPDAVRVVSDSLDSPADFFSSITQISLSEQSLGNERAQLRRHPSVVRRLVEGRAFFRNAVALLAGVVSTPVGGPKQ